MKQREMKDKKVTTSESMINPQIVKLENALRDRNQRIRELEGKLLAADHDYNILKSKLDNILKSLKKEKEKNEF